MDSHHRDTLEKLLGHAPAANIEWRQVRSLLEAVGTVDQEHNGRLRVTIGSETEVIDPPRDKDIDEQMAVDLRRMLTAAGITPES
ncbi:MAG: hypothetical protein JOY72_08875 [Actinobacteria bacterium]|nr:hypothetical protein [Actinomycetota bacterium]